MSSPEDELEYLYNKTKIAVGIKFSNNQRVSSLEFKGKLRVASSRLKYKQGRLLLLKPISE